MVEISASILSVKADEALKTFYNLETAGINYFHIDVMDGKFVDNSTQEVMFEYASMIKQISNLPLDVHLMVEDVEKYIEEYSDLNPSYITFHLESVKEKDNIYKIIENIKNKGIKVGISIKPNTDIKEIYPFLKYINMVLVMTVEPGYGGQKLIPETIEKVSKLKEYINNEELDTYIQVDGGINEENVKELIKAGAEILVAGNAIIKSEDYKQTVEKLKNNK